MNKLNLKLSEYVTFMEISFNNGAIGFKEFTNLVCNYNRLITKSLKLEMFVPCDEDGNVLEA